MGRARTIQVESPGFSVLDFGISKREIEGCARKAMRRHKISCQAGIGTPIATGSGDKYRTVISISRKGVIGHDPTRPRHVMREARRLISPPLLIGESEQPVMRKSEDDDAKRCESTCG